MTLEFADDDKFWAWCHANPDGLVVNTRRTPDPDYFVLHSAQCPTLHRRYDTAGAYTQRGYRKFAALKAEEFKPLMRREGIGGFSRRCSLGAPKAVSTG
jgi:hypothetical protein